MGNSYDIHQCTLGLRKTAAALILTIILHGVAQRRS